MVSRRVLILGVAIAASAGVAGASRASANQVAQADGQAAPELTAAQIEELDLHRQIITDTDSRPESRRRMAERLLKLGNPGRIDLVVELLSPGAAAAICEALVSVGTKQPELLDARFVDPLLTLLGDERSELPSKAAAALSVFRDGVVAARLGALASDGTRPMRQRLSAIDALAMNTDRREIVAELITLASSTDAAVVARVVDALRPASRVDFGGDVAAWQAWWEAKQTLDDADWLRDRLDLTAQLNQSLMAELSRLREESEMHRQRMASSICDLLRANLQLTQPTPREASLIQRLTHSMVEHRLCALVLVRERIQEGERPGDAVRAAVKECLADDATEVRVEALQIVGNLKDPTDAAEVLALLANEKSPTVREAILLVLGRLENPVALDALVSELASPNAPTGCVREAAIAIGAIFQCPDVPPTAVASVVTPLRERLASAAPDNLRLREALLGAMAKIGDRAFAPEFAANLASESPELVVASIRGVEVIGDADQLDRLLEHLGHADPRVRQVAAAAVGSLGSGPEHLQALHGRLNPDVEPSERVRNETWDAFRLVLTKNPTLYMQWVDRSGRFPDRQIELLSSWIESRAGKNGASPDLNDARWKLSLILDAEDRFAEAIPHLQDLGKAFRESGDPRTASVDLALLRASLYGERHDHIEELVGQVCSYANGDVARKKAIADAIVEYLDLLRRTDIDRFDPLVERLKRIPVEALGSEWSARLAALADSADGSPEGAADTPTP